MDEWIEARERRRAQSLIAPLGALVIGIVTLTVSGGSIVWMAFLAAAAIALMAVVMATTYLSRRGSGKDYPALLPSSIVTGGPATTTRPGRLDTRSGTLVWTPWGSQHGASSLVWTPSDLVCWRMRRVWGLVPNYYLVLESRDGAVVPMFTHYAPEIVRMAPDLLREESRSA